ncbi:MULTISPECIES: ABC transporter ATP-binding protein [Amycolatopsis]|uniref:ABC transporter ATP-binding protein n=1 Tax=Amycolatopsis dendrobii TaxID=2760662 RepID=A0A7W3W206_9PSEU|nr:MULTISPECIES: ABC transporter ATP-binding protein [Amycolatopsis]MBB1157388.1 ABC transporter ATP-binding protein [Amycolatopsis dendrobii]UKD59214.1 ABC transporter ATP-binding protein [Amycolatopsis sp. FU40]
MDNTQEIAAGAAIRLGGIAKRYGDVRAVGHVDLTIAPGEVVALLGPNGAGKSTTVDMILGLTTPDAGTVSVFGQAPADAVRAGMIGAMLQGGTLLDDLTVRETVGLVAKLHRRPMPVRDALRAAGVEDIADRRANKLSGGQKQRVRFAVALVSDPDLLVLDEPTAAMDVGSRREFWKSMYSFTDTGRTVLFATHYLEEAEEFADRVVLMRAGEIVADGSVAEVRALAGGRTIRAVLPAGVSDQLVSTLPAVTSFELRGERVALSSSDSDTTLRALLAAVPAVRDIEIGAVGLEGAFLSLTSDETEEAVR